MISSTEITGHKNDQNSSICSRGCKHLSPTGIAQKAHGSSEKRHKDGYQPESCTVTLDEVQRYNGDFEQERGTNDAKKGDKLLHGTFGVIREDILVGFTVDISEPLSWCFSILLSGIGIGFFGRVTHGNEEACQVF